MLEWLKTPSGAYNLTFIIAIVGWIVAGFGIFAGFHLNKVRAVQAQPRTLTREQREAFITAAANAPTGSVRVLALVSDPEAYAHAKELTGLFRTGGYNSIFVPLNNPDYMAPGIRLTVS